MSSHSLCRFSLTLLLAGALAMGGGAPAMAQTQTAGEAVVRVDPKRDLGPVNRQVLGNNALGYQHSEAAYSAQGAGLWDPGLRRPVPAMVALVRQAGVSNLRWPGGSEVHEFNWKLTVGPLETRPTQPYGLAEFLQVAHEIGAEPVITLADYWGDEKDAADLVEYLNAPVGSNPNGGIDWAMVRARQGHPDPYGVRWFEYGNETYTGSHAPGVAGTGIAMSAGEYVRRYRAIASAMRAIDPNVRLGAVLTSETSMPISAWSDTVIRGTGDIADFFIYHVYLPRLSDMKSDLPAGDLFQLIYASSEGLSTFLDRLRAEIARLTGRTVPLGISEYNVGLVPDQPRPYRLSLGSAVLVADMIMSFMNPGSGVGFADYWQMTNEHWGMLSGYQPPYLKRPAYYVFSMFNDHLGDRLVQADVSSGEYQTKGGFGVRPTGRPATRFAWGKVEPVQGSWKLAFNLWADADVNDAGTLGVDLPAHSEMNYHHARIHLPTTPGVGFRVTAEVRTAGLTRTGAQLEVIDDRGWEKTKSSSLSPLVRSDAWTPVAVDYVSLPDAKGIEIVARRLGSKAEGGRMEFRNVKVQRFMPDRLAGVPYLTAMTTMNKGTVSIFMVNRNSRVPMKVRIDGIPAGADRAWTLSGPAVDSDNEKNPEEVVPATLSVRRQSGSLVVTLPAHSFSVISTELSQR